MMAGIHCNRVDAGAFESWMCDLHEAARAVRYVLNTQNDVGRDQLGDLLSTLNITVDHLSARIDEGARFDQVTLAHSE